jgi:hypothetical protein
VPEHTNPWKQGVGVGVGVGIGVGVLGMHTPPEQTPLHKDVQASFAVYHEVHDPPEQPWLKNWHAVTALHHESVEQT